MKLLVLNGPNINMLGIRQPEIYGSQTYTDLIAFIEKFCQNHSISVECFQSNHEGNIIDKIHQAYNQFDGIVINPAAFTHTSIAILDALKAVDLPAVEVHLTDISRREIFRQTSYTSLACLRTFYGFGFESYSQAILYLMEHLKDIDS